MPSELNFLVLDRGAAAPRSPRPVFLLRKDNWDDFGHKVYFHLSHIGTDQRETTIGPLRILQRTSSHSEPIEVAKTTELPPSFSTLDDHFISLGQEETYSALSQDWMAHSRSLSWMRCATLPGTRPSRTASSQRRRSATP